MKAFDVNSFRAAVRLGCQPWQDWETIERVEALLEGGILAGVSPTDRNWFSPGHVTCSAIAVGDCGRVALIRHRILGRWLLPGGHVEPLDDDLVCTAIRELVEEIGLPRGAVTPFMDAAPAPKKPLDGLGKWLTVPASPFDIDIHPIPANPDRGQPEHLHYDMRWLVRADFSTLIRAVGGNVATGVEQPSLTDEIAGWMLVAPSDRRLGYRLNTKLERLSVL